MTNLALNQNPTPPNFFVKVTLGPNKGDVYKISPPGVIIGRDPKASQITLYDARVSRQQCRIDFLEENITIEDLSGKSSTLVNGSTIFKIHELRHGDVIVMGDSTLVFEVAAPAPKLMSTSNPGFRPPSIARNLGATFGGPNPSSAKNKRLVMIAGVGIVLFLALLLMPSTKPPAAPRVAGNEEVNAAIEAVQKRQLELEKVKTLDERELYNRRSAEKHFIRGFRDFQNGKYNRAIEAFQTTLATDPRNVKARRYYRLAEKKRQDMVDYHMDLGNKYHEKSMYKYCMAEFEKVLQIINQPNHKKYQLAKEKSKECRLSLQGVN